MHRIVREVRLNMALVLLDWALQLGGRYWPPEVVLAFYNLAEALNDDRT